MDSHLFSNQDNAAAGQEDPKLLAKVGLQKHQKELATNSNEAQGCLFVIKPLCSFSALF